MRFGCSLSDIVYCQDASEVLPVVKVNGFTDVLRLLRALHTYNHCQSALNGLFDEFSYDSVARLVEHCVDTFVFDLSLVFYAVVCQ